MITEVVVFDGVALVVPVISGRPMEFLQKTFNKYPPRCGPGPGFGNIVVPDTMLGLPVSVPCHIHDVMWEVCEATWGGFHYSNSVLLHNLLTVIKERSDSCVLEHLRNYRAVTYYNAVDTIGAGVFWGIKGEK